MAHELTQNQNGQYEMAYAGEKPWHGLGQPLKAIATADEILQAANLEWTVSQREIMTLDGVQCHNHRAIVRDDNSLVLSVMSDNYQPIQNVEAASLMSAIVGAGDLAMFETAGSIFHGKKVFFCAKLPGHIRAASGDMIEKYLIGVNSHDGTMSFRVFFSTIRVVCNNTLRAALGGMKAKESVSIYHIGDVQGRIKEAQNVLRLAHNYYADFEQIVERLVAKQADRKMIDKMIHEVFLADKQKENDPEEISAVTQENIDTVMANFSTAPENNLPGIKGSAWSLLNAFTQYADHQTRTTAGSDADKRMNSILFGGAQEIKAKAFKTIVSLVK